MQPNAEKKVFYSQTSKYPQTILGRALTNSNLQQLPQCLSYLEEPYLHETDEEIVVATLSSAQRNGMKGVSQIYTALVPLESIDEVLKHPGGMGYMVKSWGPFPCVDDDGVYHTNFWIDGPGNQSFEPLVVGWTDGFRTVMLPDNGFLMTYGLSPRFITSESKILWDDLTKPVHDVVSVKPLSKYSLPQHSGAEVRINRNYVEDFASLKGCALVTVFWEKRWCPDDEELKTLLNGKQGASFTLPGKRLTIGIHNSRSDTPYLCEVWGTRLILIPESRPITDEKELTLIWPGYTEEMTDQKAMQSLPLDFVYAKDEVLCLFENKPEYDVDPETGSVQYEAQWSLSPSERIGRNFIGYELKKLYEGCPPYIIQHVHRFAVTQEVAEQQKTEFGNANIGSRASRLIQEYLFFTQAIADLGDQVGLVLEASDIGTLDEEEIEYKGWWSLEELKHLGLVTPLAMSEADFLHRCTGVYKVLEKIKEKALRRVVIEMGVNKEQIEDYRSLKLLSVLMELLHIANESGLSIKDEREQIVTRLEDNPQIEAMGYLFALNDLRVIDSHSVRRDQNEKYLTALNIYGIDKTAMSKGWGRATDQIYDILADAFFELSRLSRQAILNTK
jgi:hypothetical protein